MREFLRQVLLLNGCIQRSWHVARLDYARWHMMLNCAKVRLEDVAFLWEEAEHLVAILIPDGGPGEAHLCVHPSLRTLELEEEMLCVAEEHLAEVSPSHSQKLCVWAPEQDQLRRELLSRHGYVKGVDIEHQWRRSLEAPIEDVPIYPGYSIRS